MGSIPIARSTLRLPQTTLDNSPEPKTINVGKILGFSVELWKDKAGAQMATGV
jgi:hypothetical protein